MSTTRRVHVSLSCTATSWGNDLSCCRSQQVKLTDDIREMTPPDNWHFDQEQEETGSSRSHARLWPDIELHVCNSSLKYYLTTTLPIIFYYVIHHIVLKNLVAAIKIWNVATSHFSPEQNKNKNKVMWTSRMWRNYEL